MEYTAQYVGRLGNITLASDGSRLTGLWFNGQKHFAATLDKEHEQRQDLLIFEQTLKWLDIYFSGKIPDFTPPINLKTTPFRAEVCEIMLAIPYGKTMTYGEIAQRIAHERHERHFSSQAVGGAVAHNAISLIVPCHRVVGADGSLTGYAGGVDRKKKLLEMERNALESLTDRT